LEERERERVEAQARKAASLHREIMELYHEVEFRRSK